MTKLEDLKRGATVKGIVPDCMVTVVDVKWYGSAAVELTYKDTAGKPSVVLLYRDREPTLEIGETGRPWSFDGDGKTFRLVSEAQRINLAHLFDPLLAIHTSMVDALPHQITAVYGEMLPRQPLRFLLADDPGAGKTIMAGLLIKELLIRGDLHRCLIVCPGNLAEQWQDELYQRFQLPFEILTNDKLESARTGNWFAENSMAICRLDKLSRNEDVQAKLTNTDWDLIICDEAHKMSATFFGNEVKYTKRYRLGQLLGQLTRHFLLMTATPHNGKEEDFQLFMALLDADRFEGRDRDGVHTVDASDLMRRLVKEQLLKFDGTPLFPERRAYTVGYKLSDAEAALYKNVTDYVRDEFNRADALENEGRKGTVGFALTILQRRLASSPEAILQSLRRRRERLERRLREEQILKRGGELQDINPEIVPDLTDEDIDELDDAPDAEVEQAEETVVDQATAARTIAELEAEIEILRRLEALALKVRRSGTDKKWEELSGLLQNHAEMFDAHGHRRKLVIFTEHRDTLNYLSEKLRAIVVPEALVTIHGGMGREERAKAQEAFKQDKDVLILLATDAAGEGINLQRAHLMVNYDLPWNPNRLEQRFGRIHRIGQTEVCHLWNLLAEETREGDVYKRLLESRRASFKYRGAEGPAPGTRILSRSIRCLHRSNHKTPVRVRPAEHGSRRMVVKPQGIVELGREALNSALHDMLYPLVAHELRSRLPGHCMRVSDLDELLAVGLARRLRENFSGAQVFILSDSRSRGIPRELAVSSTKLVELRNPLPDGSLRPPLLVFLPPNLRTSAEDSFGIATFEQFKVQNPYQELGNSLLADLPQDARVPVTEIINTLRDSRWHLADALPICRFLLTIRENDFDAQAVGAALYEFGLVPHFRLLDDSARVPWQIKRNMRSVEKLTISEKTERGRVVELGLVDTTFRAELGAFLEQVGADDPRVWTRRIALDPAAWRFSFDKWQLPDSGQQPDQVCIHSVEFDLPEVQASTIDARLRELIGQKYLPLGPAGVRSAEVSFCVNPVPNRVNRLAKFLVQLVSREAGPVGNAKAKKAWKTDRTEERVKLTGLQKLDLEEGWYFVRVRAVTDQNDFVPLVDRSGQPVTGLDQDRNPNESDLFYVLPGASTEEDSVPKSVAEAETLVHAVAKTRIQAVREGRSADSVQVTFCDWVHTEGKSRAVKQDEIEVRLGRDGAFRIPVSRVLRDLEERILKDPERLGTFRMSIEGGAPGSPTTTDELQAGTSAAQEFRAERKNFLSAIARLDRSGTSGRPLICQAANWESLSAIVLPYAQAYHRWIKNLLRSVETRQSGDQQQVLAELRIALSLDSVQITVRNHRGRHREAVLVGPTHPLRALWFASWAKLGRAWVDTAAMEPQKYGEGTLRSLLNKLAPVNFPAFIPVDMGRVFATVDSVQPMWSLYAPTREEDPRGLLGEVCSALGLPEPATFGAAIAAEDLADRVQRYVLQHPYVRTLHVNVFNGGRARAVAELLLYLQSSPNLADLKYDIRLFVSDPAAPGVGESIEALFSPEASVSTPEADQFLTPTGNHLFPKLAFAVRSLEDFRKEPNRYQAHVSMLFDLFPAEEVGATAPIQRDSAVAVYGLVQEFDSAYSEEDSFVVWKRQPRHGIAQGLLGSEELTDELSRLPETVSHATAVVATGQVSSEIRPVVSLVLRAEERALLHKVHENSDWVFTVDRNLGLEFFDHGRADRPEYLIDYSLDQTSFAGHRFVVSSRSLSELEAMLRPTLNSYNLEATGEHAAILLSQLRSLSGRLALKLISSPTQRAEVLGLALARLYLAYQGAISNQIVVPLDSHLELYNTLDETGESISLQRTDLALFDLNAGDKVINCRLIEVKCYKNVGGIGSYQQLRSRINSQIQRSEDVIRYHFDPELYISDRPDRQLKNRELANLLEFYLDRGVRYKIISPTVEQEARFLLRTLDYGYKLRFTRSAIIFDFEKSGTEQAETEDQIEFHRIGFDLIKQLVDGIAPRGQNADSSGGSSQESWTDSTVPKLRSAAFLVPERDRTVSWDDLRRARVLGDDTGSIPSLEGEAEIKTESRTAENEASELQASESRQPLEQPIDSVVNHAHAAPPPSTELTADVTIGINERSVQFGILGEVSGRRVALDLNHTHTISLFGVQGGGKSYTLGAIVEMATMPIPGINELPRPLGTVIFHFSTTQAYAPEFVTMTKPNSDPEMIEQLRQKYGCRPKGIGDVVLLAPADKVDERRAEFPRVTVMPLAFSSKELQASHWRFLMGAVGSQSLYMKQINHIMRDLRQNLSWDRIREAVANSHLPDNLKVLAETRLNLARLYIDDHSSVSSAIRPGRLVIVDLRDEFLEKDEALGLFVVILQLVADATDQGKKFNKLVVFDEAHKYIESADLVAGLVEVIREIGVDPWAETIR